MNSLNMPTPSISHKENESNEKSYLIQNQSDSKINKDNTNSSQPTAYNNNNNNDTIDNNDNNDTIDNNDNSDNNDNNDNNDSKDSEISLDNDTFENLETSNLEVKKRKKRTLIDEKLIIEKPRNKKQTPPPQLSSLQQAITNTHKKRKYTKRAKVNKITDHTNKYQEQENQEKFEVEAIIQHVLYRNRVLRYIVKWKNYPDSENTREPAAILHEDCRDLCIEYWRRQPLKEPLPDNVKSTFGLTEADKYDMEHIDTIQDKEDEEQQQQQEEEEEEEEHYQFNHDHQHQYFDHQEYNEDNDINTTFTNQRKQKTDQQLIEPYPSSTDPLFYTQPNDGNYSNIDLQSDNESFDSFYFGDGNKTEKEKEKEKRNGKTKKNQQDKRENGNKRNKNDNYFEDQNGEHEDNLNENDDDVDDDDGNEVNDDDYDDEKDRQCYRLKYKQNKLKKDDIATTYRKNGYEWAYTKSPDVFDWKKGSFKIQTVLPLKNRVTQLLVYIEWSYHLKTVHFVEELHEKAPVKLCLYFQERIRYEN